MVKFKGCICIWSLLVFILRSAAKNLPYFSNKKGRTSREGAKPPLLLIPPSLQKIMKGRGLGG
jgi:hypothetical protein